MTSPYHSGELAVQTRAGVQEEADQLGKIISSSIKPAAQDFLSSQRLMIAGTVGASGQVWASLLTGKPGFVKAVSEQTVRVDAAPVPGDPLNENLQLQNDIGILVIDLATRRRLRLNGKAEVWPGEGLYIHVRQAYFNCPKYIQSRHLAADDTEQLEGYGIQRVKALTKEQQRWIMRADTFFIASFRPQSGADASHRGGYPNFIQVLSANKLVFPDYSGNNMFNTLGNIAVNPNVGLLFIDFEFGRTLQLTGKASIIWSTDRAAEFAGAERVVAFQIDEAIDIFNASPLRWRFVEYSPFNPA
jgi:predicted pyridoxine 5'-phosphate oxidase superfamily flavin-nucleotide-binding protein